MTLGILFWVLMLICFIFGFWNTRQVTPAYPWGNHLISFILLAILGWKVFGSIVQ